jgi:alkylation response protein AidB-like acyl-CoA dehydrogenase
MPDLTDEEREIVAAVSRFVDEQVRPVVRDLDHADEYPGDLIERMKKMGVFGLVVPESFGGSKVSTPCFALVTEELARGWMSLAGAMGGHSVVCGMIASFGTPQQQAAYLPSLATGEMRAAMALTEPEGGSDLAAIRTVARKTDGGYVLSGAKTWITNGRRAQLVAVLCKTDPQADPAHSGVSVMLVEREHGIEVPRDLSKLGYKGVETSELLFSDLHIPETALLGGVEGKGFSQMMQGLELGRIQVAARAVGVARAAFEDSLEYVQVRQTFGKFIWEHQLIGGYLADMATKLTAARLLVLDAAERLDQGGRCDLEAGMAKLFASEAAMEITMSAMRIHGAYGYSTEFDIERYFRDSPLMIVGEGTNEIQRNVIARRLVARSRLAEPLESRRP